MKNVKGFTLIELMIVIAILGILLAIAIPAYQDYAIRAKVSEGLNLAAAAKLAVSEYRLSNQVMPTDLTFAGYTSPSTSIVSGITIAGGVGATIFINYQAAVVPGGGAITLFGTFANSAVTWLCKRDNTLNLNYTPSSCR